jgi:ribosomal protein S27E
MMSPLAEKQHRQARLGVNEALQVSLPTDEDGFLSQRCPSCERTFKVRFGEGAEEPIAHCPYCGYEGIECWWTNEQAEYVSAVAAAELLGPELKRLTRRMSSTGGLIDIRGNVTLPEVPATPLEVDDPGFAMVTFPCCNETIKHDGEAEQLNCIICGKTIEVIMERADKVFLSHKGRDKPKVREFKEILAQLGFRPWLDEDAMPAGTVLERGISQGFKDSCAVVFFVTPDFKDENYLATEVEYAIREKRAKGDQFQIITLCLHGKDGDKGQVPDLLQPYVWKTPQTDLGALQEILKALPISVGGTRWKDKVASARASGNEENSHKNKQLGPEASKLLAESACNDGEILAVRSSGGFHIQAGTTSFVEESSPRSEATWQSALDELVRRGFIRDRGHKGEVFGVTKEGYEFVDSMATQDDLVKTILALKHDEIAYLMTMSRPRNQSGIPSDFFDTHSGREGERYQTMIDRFLELELMRYASGAYKITSKGYEVTDRLWLVFLLRSISELSNQNTTTTNFETIAEMVKLTDGELEAHECERLLSVLLDGSYIARGDSNTPNQYQALPKAESLCKPLKSVSFKDLTT